MAQLLRQLGGAGNSTPGADAGLLEFLFLVDDDARRHHHEEAFGLAAVADVLEQPVDVRNLA